MLIILVRANAPDPKYVTLFGMSTYTKEDPSKALTPIDEILLGIFTEFTFEFLKASPSISSTVNFIFEYLTTDGITILPEYLLSPEVTRQVKSSKDSIV